MVDINLGRPLRVLLLPDVRGWAFDVLSSALVKYNPCPGQINYERVFLIDRPKIDLDSWDYVYVMLENTSYVPNHPTKVIRGCYAAVWLESKLCSKRALGERFSQNRAVVFANNDLCNSVVPYFSRTVDCIVIHDASDSEVFYPIPGAKYPDFTAIFVGNTRRKIKNFPIIQAICADAGVRLIVAENILHSQLVNEYAKADVCINFSDAEGGPQTFLEAALCGVPMLIRDNNEMARHIPCFVGATRQDFIRILSFLKSRRLYCEAIGKLSRDAVLGQFTYDMVASKFAVFFLDLARKDLGGLKSIICP